VFGNMGELGYGVAFTRNPHARQAYGEFLINGRARRGGGSARRGITNTRRSESGSDKHR